MMVSIIIPTYNSAEYISRGLESAINQTYFDIEIIVIDDGSIDETSKIVEKYVKKDTRVKYIQKENGGVSSARNIGIKESLGDYIIFLDSDDWLEKNAIKTLVDSQNCNPNTFICCDCYTVTKNNDGALEKKYINNGIGSCEIQVDEAIRNSERVNYHFSSSCYKLFNGKIIRDNKLFFDENIYYAEDGLFTFKYLQTQTSIYFISKPFWNILDRNDSASNKGYNKKMITMSMAYEKMIDLFSDDREMKLFFIKSQIVKTLYILSLCLSSRNYSKSDASFFRSILKKYKKYWKECQNISIIKLKLLVLCHISFLRILYKIKVKG